jgi:hypothetical protein
MIDSTIYHCIKIIIAPKTAAANTDVTEYLSNAGKEAKGFQNCAVHSRSNIHRIRTVHLAQFFISFNFRNYQLLPQAGNPSTLPAFGSDAQLFFPISVSNRTLRYPSV